MDYSFPRYLLSKQSVDDRALNRTVLQALKANLPGPPLHILEVGAGVGSMLRRLLQWNLLPARSDYTMVDEMPENITAGRSWLSERAAQAGYQADTLDGGDIRLTTPDCIVQARFVKADVFDFIRSQSAPTDLLIAHAFLDLLPLPGSLSALFSLIRPHGLAWLTLNFDGMTTFEPVIDPALDAQLEMLFHQTMDHRLTNGLPSGDSRTGRHLFAYLEQAGAEILSAGASDWVVYPGNGRYPADEAFFLQFILHFFETSLTGHRELDQAQFDRWLAARRAQLEKGELVYIAHQLDFLVRV